MSAYSVQALTHKKNVEVIYTNIHISQVCDCKKASFTYLVQLSPCQLPFHNNHYQRREQNDEAMPNVTEHNSEQERESDDSKETGVDFLVGRDTIAVHDTLETSREFVRSVEGWRLLICTQLVQDWTDVSPRLFLERL